MKELRPWKVMILIKDGLHRLNTVTKHKCLQENRDLVLFLLLARFDWKRRSFNELQKMKCKHAQQLSLQRGCDHAC